MSEPDAHPRSLSEPQASDPGDIRSLSEPQARRNAPQNAPDPVLRPWHPDDAPALVDAYLSTPDLSTQFAGTDLSTEAFAFDFIRRMLQSDDRRKNWAITVDDVAVGNVGASMINRRHDTAWVFYWLTASARGHGWATRALATVADWALADGLYRLELGHRVNNSASCRVATRAGFAPEGIERHKLRYDTPDGIPERFDVELHARLAIDSRPSITPLSMVE